MTESKKAWVTPELIVLVRSKPDEAVLEACKGAASGGPSEFYAGDACAGLAPGCAVCLVIAAS
jgi:hypothetical protein